MGSRKYATGISALKSEFFKISKNKELIAILELSPNKYTDGFYDVKVKNLYEIYQDGFRPVENRIKYTIYKCLKLKEPREYAVIRYHNNSIEIDEELTSKVVVKDMVGKYGSFRAMYLRCEYSDYETL